jgi:hypothetical protein
MRQNTDREKGCGRILRRSSNPAPATEPALGAREAAKDAKGGLALCPTT